MKDKKTFGVKALAALAAVALALGCVIGGTMAWLTDKTGAVTNTFTTSDIGVTLAESENLDLKMIPGHTISKDPKVTVTADSEDCYVFVKIEESSSLKDYIKYRVNTSWTQLCDKDDNPIAGVYYMTFDSKDNANTNRMGQPYAILGAGNDTIGSVSYSWEENEVLVLPSVTKTMMNDLKKTGAVQPTLTFTAYAAQLYKDNNSKFEPYEAWDIVNPTT